MATISYVIMSRFVDDDDDDEGRKRNGKIICDRIIEISTETLACRVYRMKIYAVENAYGVI